MKVFHSILIPATINGGRARTTYILRNSMVLAAWLKSELHVLVVPERMKITEKEIHSVQRYQDLDIETALHQLQGEVSMAILDAINAYDIDCLVLEFNPNAPDPSHLFPKLKQSILELCPVPILLIPNQVVLVREPFKSILVPLSGEKRSNEAVELALQLAGATHTPTDVMHVTAEEGECSCGALLSETIGDEFHHEFPEQVDQMIVQASPFSTARERRYVRRFCHCYGDVADEVTKVMRETPKGLLVLEWKGIIKEGRANTLKSLLSRAEYPVLLTKRREKQGALLRVGARF